MTVIGMLIFAHAVLTTASNSNTFATIVFILMPLILVYYLLAKLTLGTED